LLAVLFLVGCTKSSTPQPAGTQTPLASTFIGAEPTDGTQSFGDFSFSIPRGWYIVMPDRDKTKAMVLLGGSNWQNAKAMIKIDVGSPAAPTARQLAEGFVKSAGGSVSADALDFDGTPGVSASTSSNELTKPQNMIIVYRDGKA